MSGRPISSTLAVGRVLVPLALIFLAGCDPVQVIKHQMAEGLIDDAYTMHRKGKYKESVRLLRKAADFEPLNQRVWGRLCNEYQNTEELDLAIAACQRQIAMRGDELDYNSLGRAYLAKKDYAKAVSAFETAVKICPDSAFYSNLVFALQGAGLSDKAIEAAEKGADFSGESPFERVMALQVLVDALENAKQYEKAILAAKRMVEAGRKIPMLRGQVFRTLIWAQVRAQHYDQAIAPAQELVEASARGSKHDDFALETLGALYMKLGQKAKAHEVFAKIPKSNPKESIRTCEIDIHETKVTCYYSR